MPAPSSAVTGIPGRYATALFELAQERNVLDAVAGDLASLRQLIGESDDLRRLVRSPLYGREAQARAMQAVLEQGGAHDLTRRFVGMLTHNRRLFTLADVARAYAQLLAQHRGEMVAYVTSAHALEGAQLDAIRAEVAAATRANIRVEAAVDPALLGGMVVQVGSRMIDSSLRTKLQRLKFTMKGAQ